MQDDKKIKRNKRLRGKYKSDPEFRAAHKDRQKRYRINKKSKLNGRVERVDTEGNKVVLYPLSWIARESGVNLVYLRDLSRDYFPKTPKKRNKSALYSKNQVDMIMGMFAAYKESELSLRSFVQSYWTGARITLWEKYQCRLP